jgi:hypothetical protein
VSGGASGNAKESEENESQIMLVSFCFLGPENGDSSSWRA